MLAWSARLPRPSAELAISSFKHRTHIVTGGSSTINGDNTHADVISISTTADELPSALTKKLIPIRHVSGEISMQYLLSPTVARTVRLPPALTLAQLYGSPLYERRNSSKLSRELCETEMIEGAWASSRVKYIYHVLPDPLRSSPSLSHLTTRKEERRIRVNSHSALSTDKTIQTPDP